MGTSTSNPHKSMSLSLMLLSWMLWKCQCFLGVLPGSSKLTGVGNYSEFAPVTLTEPGATASRHWDMSGFSWPWSLQVVSCVSLTDNFWPHTAVLGTWATLKGSALTGCHIFSPELAVSNLSLSTSGLGHFHFDFTLPLTPLSLREPEVFCYTCQCPVWPKSPDGFITTLPQRCLSRWQSHEALATTEVA